MSPDRVTTMIVLGAAAFVAVGAGILAAVLRLGRP